MALINPNSMTQSGWKKYIYTFLITSLIFGTALSLSNFFSDKKIAELKATENKIAIDILSSETQFALLGELPCTDVTNSTLSQELNSLGKKLDYSEQKFGPDDPDFIQLKKYYSLLEIKDFLLVKKLSSKCPQKPTSILYFYSNDCKECDKEGYVLTFLREQYPDLRVYSFDYNLELSALKTLASIYKVTPNLPALVIENKLYSGFQSLEEIKGLIPEITNASTTPKSNETKKR